MRADVVLELRSPPRRGCVAHVVLHSSPGPEQVRRAPAGSRGQGATFRKRLTRVQVKRYLSPIPLCAKGGHVRRLESPMFEKMPDACSVCCGGYAGCRWLGATALSAAPPRWQHQIKTMGCGLGYRTSVRSRSFEFSRYDTSLCGSWRIHRRVRGSRGHPSRRVPPPSSQPHQRI